MPAILWNQFRRTIADWSANGQEPTTSAEHLGLGNRAQYENVQELPNPKHDAEDVAAALECIGFKIILGVDLTKTEMEDATIRFAREARTADVALFDYSGHALQFGGVNY